MKIAGHTMGTPEYTISEAIKLFHDINLDGIEIVVQDNYKCGIPVTASTELLSEIKTLSKKYQLHIACLTPYNSNFNSEDEELREHDISEIIQVINFAAYLGAQYIRLYAGNVSRTTGLKEENYHYIKDSLQRLGNHAAEKNIILLLENHFNTMTVSAKDSFNMMKWINHPNVRILYDQANLTFTRKEDYEEALSLQKDYIAYVHVKDLVFKKDIENTIPTSTAKSVSHQDENERIVSTRIVGEGILPWESILKDLKHIGYDGWLSLEYERRWHPNDIPDAKIGMKKSAEYLHSCLNCL
ncbi:MAG: sugar phosphate isomerase/epimerase family protein [Lachnospiraceae bacterium]